MNEVDNIKWIAKGNTGCVFATLFAKNPESVGWITIPFWAYHPDEFTNDDLIVSITFPVRWNVKRVKDWALGNGFYTEDTSLCTEGLRIKCNEGVSWVQYFGPDSHVKTRQSPRPMLMYTRKLNKLYYAKVGFKGLLHLAHAFSESVKESVYDLLWNRSYNQTKKLLGHIPTINEAAKTTWKKY